MIDTIRIKTRLNLKQFHEISSVCEKLEKVNLSTGFVSFRLYKGKINLGSYDKNINFILYDESTLFMELSLPKYLFGQNINLLYAKDLKPALFRLYNDLINNFPNFPKPQEWELMRLDLCYTWKFPTQNMAENVLKSLKRYKYPRKHITDYDHTLYASGRKFTIKFYLKNPEFIKHDKDNVISFNAALYKHLNTLSEGCLRFEVELRREYLELEFPECFYKALSRDTKVISIQTQNPLFNLNDDKIYKILKKYFDKYIKGLGDNIMGKGEIFATLNNKYSKAKSTRLFTYWLMMNNPETQQIVKDGYTRQQHHKNEKDLKDVGITLISTPLSNDIDLNIPSIWVINSPEVDSSSLEEEQRAVCNTARTSTIVDINDIYIDNLEDINNLFAVIDDLNSRGGDSNN